MWGRARNSYIVHLEFFQPVVCLQSWRKSLLPSLKTPKSKFFNFFFWRFLRHSGSRQIKTRWFQWTPLLKKFFFKIYPPWAPGGIPGAPFGPFPRKILGQLFLIGKTIYSRAHFHQKTFCYNLFQVKSVIDPSIHLCSVAWGWKLKKVL